MSIEISGGGVAGITVESDPTAVKLTGDTMSGTLHVPEIRNLLNTNLIIDSYNDNGAGTHYEHKFTPFDGKFLLATNGGGLVFPDGTTQTTAATGSGFTGGTVTSPIIFDGTSGQQISKGSFDTSRGGNYGISLICSIGYEFNWQAGWLRTTEQDYVTPRPLYLDSLAGTTLRAWNSSTSTGTEITHTGITFANSTTQTTAGLPLTGGTLSGKVICTTSAAGVGLNVGTSSVTPTPTIAGDIWIGSNINFKAHDGTAKAAANSNTANTFSQPQTVACTSINAGLKITQLGTGNAFVVEDSTPDSSPFLINGSGQVVIGGTSSANASVGLTVLNGIQCTAGANGSNQFIGELDLSSIYQQSNTTIFASDYPFELLVAINGQPCYIPFRIQ
jgi:hypothetical protein